MPAEYKIRRFQPADMDRVLEIERASFGQDAYDRKLFAEYGRKCGGLFLVAEGSRTIDGYSIACVSEKRGTLIKRGTTIKRGILVKPIDLVASLESIAVDPRARGQGAASSLLKSTIRRLKLQGVGRITLMVRRSNAVALQFYERRGFIAVRRAPGYYEDGGEGLVMRLTL
jgi:[ribosomal protein S18]-alanine N-acetyltransferase